jgi:hypothetical protein
MVKWHTRRIESHRQEGHGPKQGPAKVYTTAELGMTFNTGAVAQQCGRASSTYRTKMPVCAGLGSCGSYSEPHNGVAEAAKSMVVDKTGKF